MVPINYVAVLVAAFAGMCVGMMWFGPMFGKAWIKIMGFTEADMKKAQEKGMGKTYLIAFLNQCVMAFVLAHSILFASAYLKVDGLNAGLQGGFWNWLGVAAPVLLGAVLWEGKRVKWFFLNAGYYLTTLLVMGAILATMG